jgi:hypothetical protein
MTEYPRNKPCLCGSDAKFKKCCGSPDTQRQIRDVHLSEAQSVLDRAKLQEINEAEAINDWVTSRVHEKRKFVAGFLIVMIVVTVVISFLTVGAAQ